MTLTEMNVGAFADGMRDGGWLVNGGVVEAVARWKMESAIRGR
jgi:hypothetical protein